MADATAGEARQVVTGETVVQLRQRLVGGRQWPLEIGSGEQQPVVCTVETQGRLEQCLVGLRIRWRRASEADLEGLQRIFSVQNLVNLAKMLLKTLLLGAIVALAVRAALPAALKLGYAAPATALAAGARLVLSAFAWAGLVYLLLGAIDYLHVRQEFMKRLRMSIDELRQEHKDMEGDPVNRSRRRSAHQEAVYATLADRVKAASAVIHSRRVAVALQYLGEHDLPRVIARGEGERAAQIRRAAGEALVPMEFEPALAERLYGEVPEDRPVPRPLYEPVARLLRWAQGKD